MKKAFIIVAAIALLAAPVFAEVEVAITGDATTSFGYNLDNEVFGMNSSAGADLTLTVGALDGESMGEGNWYGVIELTGANLAWDSANEEGFGYYRYEWDEDLGDDGDWDTGEIVDEQFIMTTPEVAARITNGNVYVQLQDTADFDADYVAGVDNDATDYSDPDTEGSLTIGGTFAPVTVAVEFGMLADYGDDTQASGVALGLNLGVDLAPVTVDVAFAGAFGYDTDEEIGFALKVVADVAPLTITVAFDGIIDAAVDADDDEDTADIFSGDFNYEASLGVAADLAPLTVGVDVYFAEDDLDTKLTVGFANDMITKADVFFGLYDIMAPSGTDLGWEFGVDLTLVPASGITANAGMAFDSGSILTAYADVAFTELVDNVTFTLGWEDANDMLDEDDEETNNGQIYLSAGIEF